MGKRLYMVTQMGCYNTLEHRRRIVQVQLFCVQLDGFNHWNRLNFLHELLGVPFHAVAENADGNHTL